MSKIPYFQFKIEKNNVNNYLRVKMTSNHINMDINGFYGSKKFIRRLHSGSECCMLYSQLVEGAKLSTKSGRKGEKDNMCGSPHHCFRI